MRRLSTFQGNLVTVLFRPEDLELVLRGPSVRREFMDEVLSQVDSEYSYENSVNLIHSIS